MSEALNSEKRLKQKTSIILAALLLGAYGVLLWSKILSEPDSIIMLDVNPSLSLSVDAEERVLSAEAFNEDAKEILGSMELKGTSLEAAINALIGSMLQKGYLGEQQNAVLVSVENQDAVKGEQLQQKVSQAIASAMQSGAADAAVLSQTVSSNDTGLEILAQQYGISIGKAALIQEVIAQDNTLTFEALSPMTINEIALIAASRHVTGETVIQTGSASVLEYIGAEEAFTIACDDAGVAAGDIYEKEVEFDSEKGIMVYEVEFKTGNGEYEYDINARTGEVLKAEVKNRGTGGAGNGGTENNNTGNTAANSYIGEEAAQEAALSHAGVKSEDTVYIHSWLEYDDGRPEHYEVEFVSGNIEYDYEIDLYTGAVLKSEMDSFDHHHDHNHNQRTGTVLTDYISEEDALDTALSHAGVTRDNASKVKVKLDREDGRAIYEVEFEAGRTEYEYEIDAVDKTVLKAESDRD